MFNADHDQDDRDILFEQLRRYELEIAAYFEEKEIIQVKDRW